MCWHIADKAAARGQVKLPAVHGAGERRAVDLAEPAELPLQMRAAPLDDPAVQLDVGLVALLAGIPAFGVHEPVERKALEERVKVLVVLPYPTGAEPHAQEQAIDPVNLMIGDQLPDQAPVHGELISPGPPPAPPRAPRAHAHDPPVP